MQAKPERAAVIARELRAALAARTVALDYRPVIDLDARRIVGFSACARWASPTQGAVASNALAAIAAESGLAFWLAEQLLRSACRDAVNWPSDFTLTFDIFPAVLRDASFRLRALAILGQTGLPPDRLKLAGDGLDGSHAEGRATMLGEAIRAEEIADLLRIPSIAEAAA
jgi:EAL domain-containing protein (putative c-di-GMP-specific phosphodiesterase class I)